MYLMPGRAMQQDVYRCIRQSDGLERAYTGVHVLQRKCAFQSWILQVENGQYACYTLRLMRFPLVLVKIVRLLLIVLVIDVVAVAGTIVACTVVTSTTITSTCYIGTFHFFFFCNCVPSTSNSVMS